MIGPKEKIQTGKLGKNLGLIQSGSVLTGILYVLIFLLMIPTFMNKGYNFDDMLINSAIILLSIIIVHFFINGLYYFVVAIPFVASVIFVVLGWVIWLNTPLVFALAELILSPLAIFMDISDLTNLSEYFTRIGQTFMTIGGGLWWIVKKAKDIDYAALYIYMIILAILGILSGFINPSISILFIIFWATLNYKIHENPNVNSNDQLKLLFKVVASLAILTATVKNLYQANNTWYGETSYGLIIYSIVMFLLVSFGIWKPDTIKKHIPKEGRYIVKKTIILFQKFIFLKK